MWIIGIIFGKKDFQEKNSKKTFSAFARLYSEDPTKLKGGDLGYFTKGEMSLPFEQLAFKMKKNEIAGPVLTRYGWHLIEKTDELPEYTLSLKEVSHLLKKQLAGIHFHKKYRTYLKQLWNSNKVISELSYQ